MLCAAALLSLLSYFGVVRQSRCDSCEEGYSSCGLRQDIRSVLSFALGAFLCNCIDSNSRGTWADEDAQAVSAGPGTVPRKDLDCLAFFW